MATKKAAKTESGPIRIVKPQPTVLSVRLVGETPLVVHQFDNKTLLEQTEKTKSKNKAPRDAEKQFENGFYRSTDGGRDYIPAAAVKGAMVSACRFLDDVPMTQARGLLFVHSQAQDDRGRDLVEVKSPDGGELWEMAEHMVRLSGIGRTPDIRWRPMARQWQIDVDVEFNAAFIRAEDIINLMMIAGSHVGLCEGRPEKSNLGWGRFRVEARK